MQISPDQFLGGLDKVCFPAFPQGQDVLLKARAILDRFIKKRVGVSCGPYENAPWVPHESKSLKNVSILKDVSYFYTARPYFLSAEYTWPAIGPELENPELKSEFDRKVSQTIPAKGRYDAGRETYIPKITKVAEPN